MSNALDYRPDIDGLRAVAILLVVAFHAGLSGFSGGFIGVDVFFVISGYLISFLMLREMDQGTFRISNFYNRRAKRILPALFGVLAFLLLSGFVLLAPHEFRALAKGMIATLLSGSNIYFWQSASYFEPKTELNPLLMTWSLGVEEQFYLLFPLLLWVLRKKSPRVKISTVSLLILASLLACAIATRTAPQAAFYLLPTRAWELLAGVMLALFHKQFGEKASVLPKFIAHSLGTCGVAMILIASARYDKLTPFPGIAAILPVLGATLFIAARGAWTNRLLANPVLRGIGKISYSWYLWHWPMLSLARIVADRPLDRITTLWIVALSLLAAIASFYILETPFRRSQLPIAQSLRRYAFASACFLIAASAIFALKGIPSRYPQVARVERETGMWGTAGCLQFYGASHPRFDAHCTPQGTGNVVALIGDSHASAIADGLRQTLRGQNARLFELTKASCTPLNGVGLDNPLAPQDFPECTRFNQEVLQFLVTQPSVRAVVMAGYWSLPLSTPGASLRTVTSSAAPQDASQLLALGLSQEIAQLQAAGKAVYLLQDSPSFAFDPVRNIMAHDIPARKMLAQLVSPPTLSSSEGVAAERIFPADQHARAVLSQVAVQHPGVHLIDLQKELCSPDLCRFEAEGLSLYRDERHLTNLGAAFALRGVNFQTM